MRSVSSTESGGERGRGSFAYCEKKEVITGRKSEGRSSNMRGKGGKRGRGRRGCYIFRKKGEMLDGAERCSFIREEGDSN